LRGVLLYFIFCIVTTKGDFPPTSRSQIEVDVAFDKLISHLPDGEWGKVAPFRILSFDIECAGRKGIFPEPDKDPVIQIANMVIRQGETGMCFYFQKVITLITFLKIQFTEPFIKTIYTLNSCAPIMEAQVLSYRTEQELLQAWAEFVRKIDSDIITGYNINNFDLWYLLSRGAHLKAVNFK
jgi:DNA polymerase delta subunit 1